MPYARCGKVGHNSFESFPPPFTENVYSSTSVSCRVACTSNTCTLYPFLNTSKYHMPHVVPVYGLTHVIGMALCCTRASSGVQNTSSMIRTICDAGVLLPLHVREALFSIFSPRGGRRSYETCVLYIYLLTWCVNVWRHHMIHGECFRCRRGIIRTREVLFLSRRASSWSV